MKVNRTLVQSLLGLILAIGALAFSINAQPRQPQGKGHADKVIATRTIVGTVVGFEAGDYLHVVVKDSSGKERSFYVPDNLSMEYFLAENKGQPVALTYQVVDTYIPEAGGTERIEAVKSARAGKLTIAAWWKQVRAKNTVAQLKKKYEKLIEEYTIHR